MKEYIIPMGGFIKIKATDPQSAMAKYYKICNEWIKSNKPVKFMPDASIETQWLNDPIVLDDSE
jgi:hypothetical protein